MPSSRESCHRRTSRASTSQKGFAAPVGLSGSPSTLEAWWRLGPPGVAGCADTSPDVCAAGARDRASRRCSCCLCCCSASPSRSSSRSPRPSSMPLAAYFVWLLVAMLLLRFGPLLIAVRVEHGGRRRDAGRPGTAGRPAGDRDGPLPGRRALVLYQASRQRSGLPVPLSEALLSDLRDRLQRQGRVPEPARGLALAVRHGRVARRRTTRATSWSPTSATTGAGSR